MAVYLAYPVDLGTAAHRGHRPLDGDPARVDQRAGIREAWVMPLHPRRIVRHYAVEVRRLGHVIPDLACGA
jgi:hypothetical protein